MRHFLAGFVFLSALFFVSCAHRTGEIQSDSLSGLPDAPPVIESKVSFTSQANVMSQIANRRVAVLQIHQLPDSYLLRAKNKINPPDMAISEVRSLQEERSSWMNESLVVHCDTCKTFETLLPLDVLPEGFLLELMDKVALKQDLKVEDLRRIASAVPGYDVLWVIFANEDYEQKRGPLAQEKGLISSWSGSEVFLRSFVYDLKKRTWLHRAEVEGLDQDLIVYQQVREEEGRALPRARVAPFQSQPDASLIPAGSIYDGERYDHVYPYPPVPDTVRVHQKSLLSLTESLTR